MKICRKNRVRNRDLYNLHKNVIALDANGECVDTLIRWILRDAGLYVEHPGVPGADDQLTFEPTLTEWPTTMRADVIDYRKLTLYICHAK
jgi:hypothetical protein